MNDTEPSSTTWPSRPSVEAAGPRRGKAEEVLELARRRDPSQPRLTGRTMTAGMTKRGVVWVRPSQLMSQATAGLLGRGIDFQAELARRTRRPALQAVAASHRAVSERARRLPPLSAFGRRGQSTPGVTRSRIGLR